MIKYAKVINNETGLCEVGLGSNSNFYKSIGMKELDVEQSEIDNEWYLSEKCPHKTEEQKLEEAKKAKHDENDKKAEIARESQIFTIAIQDKDCTFQTTRRTQQDLTTAKDFIQLTEQPYQWFSDNNEEVYLTLEDIVNISTTFIQKANVYSIWSEYETMINEAETVEEVEAIEITYNTNEEQE